MFQLAYLKLRNYNSFKAIRGSKGHCLSLIAWDWALWVTFIFPRQSVPGLLPLRYVPLPLHTEENHVRGLSQRSSIRPQTIWIWNTLQTFRSVVCCQTPSLCGSRRHACLNEPLRTKPFILIIQAYVVQFWAGKTGVNPTYSRLLPLSTLQPLVFLTSFCFRMTVPTKMESSF